MSSALRINGDAHFTTFTISILKNALEISCLPPLLGAYCTVLRRSDFLQLLSCKGLDRPLGLQEVEALRISKQSADEGSKVVTPTHWPPLSPGNVYGIHFR